MSQVRANLRNTKSRYYKTPQPQSKTQAGKQDKFTRSQAKVYNMLFNAPQNTPETNMITLQNGAGDVFGIVSNDDNTRNTVADNAVRDSKQYNVTRSAKGCDAPSYVAWDSGNKGCDPVVENGGPYAVKPRVQKVALQDVDQNSQVQVVTCGNPDTPTYQSSQSAIVASAQNSCVTTPPAPWTSTDSAILGGVLGGVALLSTVCIFACRNRDRTGERAPLTQQASSTATASAARP